MQNDWYRMDNSPHWEYQPDSRSEGALDNYSLLSVALEYWKRLIFTGLLATIFGYAVLTQVTPIYESRSQILLEVQSEPVIDIPNAVPESPDGIATLESAIILMRSPQLLRQVVEELDLTMRAEFNSRLRDPTPLERARRMVSDVKGRIGVMLGAEPAPTGSARDPVERAARALRQNVSVRIIGESRVIEIISQSESARLAAQISNTIAKKYIAQQIAVKAAEGNRVTRWLEERTEDVRKQLEEIERGLSDFGSEMAVSERAGTSDLDVQLVESTTQLIELDTLYEELEARRSEISELRAAGNYLTLASVVELPTVNALVEQLAALDATIGELTAVYGDHSKTREAQATRQQLVTLLETETARMINGLDVRLDVLNGRRDSMAAKIADIRIALVAKKQDDYRLDGLMREFETTRNVYERFLLRQKEMRQRSQFQSPGARLVSEAERPSAAAAPQKAKLSLLTGIAAGVVMLIYLTIRKARNPAPVAATGISYPKLDDFNRIGRVVTLPYLSSPHRPLENLRYLRNHPESDIAVSIQSMKSILKPPGESWTNLILVTSAGRRDGKSTLSMLLAESFSREFKTVLITTDRDGWLAEFAESGDAIHAGFDIVQYSDDLLDMMDESFASEYQLADRRKLLLGADIAILDAPAMPLSTELLEIGQQADHTVLVAPWNPSRLHRIKRCARALEEMGIAISALALNIMSHDTHTAMMTLPGQKSQLPLPDHKST